MTVKPTFRGEGQISLFVSSSKSCSFTKLEVMQNFLLFKFSQKPTLLSSCNHNTNQACALCSQIILVVFGLGVPFKVGVLRLELMHSSIISRKKGDFRTNDSIGDIKSFQNISFQILEKIPRNYLKEVEEPIKYICLWWSCSVLHCATVKRQLNSDTFGNRWICCGYVPLISTGEKSCNFTLLICV